MATDHKPLVTLLGQKSLDQVANAQLFRIKQCIMWKFKVIHCPGKANFFADATLRRPVRSDNCKTLFIAANLAAIAISREEAAAEAQEDPEYLAMHSTLSQGVALNAATCNEFFQYRDKLYPRDGVLLYDDRLVIPEGLREKVLDVLHPAHQGKLSMLHRVALTVFWPG